MTKAELESKHIAELHTLAADAGVPRYRMLRREQLIEKLLDEKPARGERAEPKERERPPRRRQRPERERPRRRRFGRRGKGLRAHELLLPPPGRQALVYGESRDACTALLREIAAELSGASKGPDPIALLVDPSPEELAEWKREVPDAELVVASKARHATDALAQASRRAGEGEDVILLVDSLARLEDPGVAKEIFDGGLKLASASGSLTVVAALERSA